MRRTSDTIQTRRAKLQYSRKDQYQNIYRKDQPYNTEREDQYQNIYRKAQTYNTGRKDQTYNTDRKDAK
jgi:hypothetical protein